jgi:uncharacterized protein YdaU (DUF1376 family)
MNRAPAFQLYVGDWLSSTKITLMTPAEEGAYIRLLCHAWADPDCTIPDDGETLARLSRLGEQWHSYGSAMNPVKACFVPHPKKPGRLINVRLYAEWKKLKAFLHDKSRAGRKGAESRWNPTTTTTRWHSHASANDNTMAQPMANAMANDGSSSSSYRERKGKRVPTEQNGHGKSFDIFWAAYPKKEGKKPCRNWWKEHKPDEGLLGVMLAKIEQAKQTQKWNEQRGKFIPMPATRLNQERWEDEYTPPRKERLPL